MHFEIRNGFIKQGSYIASNAIASLEDKNRIAKEMGRISVIDNPKLPPSGDPHDYYSVAPYWHPNPDTPDHLPYVKRDGEYNPEFFKCDRKRMDLLCDTIHVLSLGYRVLGDLESRTKALSLLHSFFVDPETKMNPHLEFAQAVLGRHTGCGIGIIDIRLFYRLFDDIRSFNTPETEKEIKPFFEALYVWLKTSEKAIDEAGKENNHGAWYDITTSSIGLFLGKCEEVSNTFACFIERRMAGQTEEDGKLTLESRRTRGLFYSTMCLWAYVIGASYASDLGLDFTNCTQLEKAVSYLVPFWEKPETWPYSEITVDFTEMWEMAFFISDYASKLFHKPEWEKLSELIATRNLSDNPVVLTRLQ